MARRTAAQSTRSPRSPRSGSGTSRSPAPPSRIEVVAIGSIRIRGAVYGELLDFGPDFLRKLADRLGREASVEDAGALLSEAAKAVRLHDLDRPLDALARARVWMGAAWPSLSESQGDTPTERIEARDAAYFAFVKELTSYFLRVALRALTQEERILNPEVARETDALVNDSWKPLADLPPHFPRCYLNAASLLLARVAEEVRQRRKPPGVEERREAPTRRPTGRRRGTLTNGSRTDRVLRFIEREFECDFSADALRSAWNDATSREPSREVLTARMASDTLRSLVRSKHLTVIQEPNQASSYRRQKVVSAT